MIFLLLELFKFGYEGSGSTIIIVRFVVLSSCSSESSYSTWYTIQREALLIVFAILTNSSHRFILLTLMIVSIKL